MIWIIYTQNENPRALPYISTFKNNPNNGVIVNSQYNYWLFVEIKKYYELETHCSNIIKKYWKSSKN